MKTKTTKATAERRLPDAREKVLLAAKYSLAMQSIARFMRGVPQRALTVARIRAAFEAEGFALPKPTSSTTKAA